MTPWKTNGWVGKRQHEFKANIPYMEHLGRSTSWKISWNPKSPGGSVQMICLFNYIAGF